MRYMNIRRRTAAATTASVPATRRDCRYALHALLLIARRTCIRRCGSVGCCLSELLFSGVRSHCRLRLLLLLLLLLNDLLAQGKLQSRGGLTQTLPASDRRHCGSGGGGSGGRRTPPHRVQLVVVLVMQ